MNCMAKSAAVVCIVQEMKPLRVGYKKVKLQYTGCEVSCLQETWQVGKFSVNINPPLHVIPFYAQYTNTIWSLSEAKFSAAWQDS